MKIFSALLIALVVGGGFAGVSDAAANSMVYTYDSFGRISEVTYGDGTVVTYTYDTAGNRTATSCTGPSC